mgnify:FL=1
MFDSSIGSVSVHVRHGAESFRDGFSRKHVCKNRCIMKEGSDEYSRFTVKKAYKHKIMNGVIVISFALDQKLS